MSVLLIPVKPKKISDQVFDQLRELISRGELKPGEQLMTERDLSEALNVSRTSVRSAIIKLIAIGLLENRQGQGTFVRMPDSRDNNLLASAMTTQNAKLDDLLEARLGLECNSAALAAQRATAEDIQFMEKSLDEMAAEIKEGRTGTEADVSFHMAIAYATKNPIQVYLMRSFYDLLFYGIKENLFYLYQDSDRIKTILKQHSQIADSIRSHNPETSYLAMKEHISYVLEFYKNQVRSKP
jgi:GntR family transcriptional regulator, transcriptional repressor for pyruvate dehydrogenase complex